MRVLKAGLPCAALRNIQSHAEIRKQKQNLQESDGPKTITFQMIIVNFHHLS